MSRINSIVEEIKKIQFEPFPTRPLKNCVVIRSGNTIVALHSSGTIYTNRVTARCFYLSDPRPYFNDVWDCLVKLKVITPKMLKEHKAHCDKMREIRIRADAARDILKYAADAKLKMTAKQKAELEASAKKGGF